VFPSPGKTAGDCLRLSVGCLVRSVAPGCKRKEGLADSGGTILDEANNGIAGATLSLTDLQTGKKLATYSKEDGQYQYSDLIPNHDYELQASYKGVLSEVRKVSSVDTRNRIVINFTFPPPKP